MLDAIKASGSQHTFDEYKSALNLMLGLDNVGKDAATPTSAAPGLVAAGAGTTGKGEVSRRKFNEYREHLYLSSAGDSSVVTADTRIVPAYTQSLNCTKLPVLRHSLQSCYLFVAVYVVYPDEFAHVHHHPHHHHHCQCHCSPWIYASQRERERWLDICALLMVVMVFAIFNCERCCCGKERDSFFPSRSSSSSSPSPPPSPCHSCLRFAVCGLLFAVCCLLLAAWAGKDPFLYWPCRTHIQHHQGRGRRRHHSSLSSFGKRCPRPCTTSSLASSQPHLVSRRPPRHL